MASKIKQNMTLNQSNEKFTSVPEEEYILRKNEFQGVVNLPKDEKKRLILQDSNEPEVIGSLLKTALLNKTIKDHFNIHGMQTALFPPHHLMEVPQPMLLTKPTTLKRQWTLVDELLWWNQGKDIPEAKSFEDNLIPLPKVNMSRTITQPYYAFYKTDNLQSKL